MIEEKIKILLAEDDLNLGVLLIDYLETKGFDVKLCKDGELALKAFQDGAFDLCLLDIMMPKMDGFALAKAIRLVDDKIPILFISAKSLKEDKLKGYGLGADDYITKPFDEEELLWKIKAVIRRMPENKGENKNEIVAIGNYLGSAEQLKLSRASIELIKFAIIKCKEKWQKLKKTVHQNRNT